MSFIVHLTPETTGGLTPDTTGIIDISGRGRSSDRPCRPSTRPTNVDDIVIRHAADRPGAEGARLQPQGSTRKDAPARRLRGPSRDPVLLPEGRHARLHEGS